MEKCKICNEVCKTKQGLGLHILYKHTNYIKPPLTEEQEERRVKHLKDTYKKPEVLQRVSEATKKGMANTDLSNRNKKISKSRKGMIFTDEHRKNISESHVGLLVGEKNHLWKGGITPVNKQIRDSHNMVVWRREVFKRDDYTCQECGERGGELNVHHIKSFSKHPKLRSNVDNGITLCKKCHKKIHKKMGIK